MEVILIHKHFLHTTKYWMGAIYWGHYVKRSVILTRPFSSEHTSPRLVSVHSVPDAKKGPS